MTTLSLDELIRGLAADGGPDLRGYKQTTLERRLRRRMSELNIAGYGRYLEYVRKNRQEPAALLSKVLINVTEFFRDPPAWEYLRQHVLPELAKILRSGNVLRVWCAGCATGEEAYSIALLLADFLGDEIHQFDIKVYASDVDEDALNVARRAEYPLEKLRKVRNHLREKYFAPVGSMLRVHRDIRRLLVFGRSNLVSNAPISHCNLVICRNVLIYFDTAAQKKIMDRLQYALDPGGILFLGKAESKLSESEMFRTLNSRWRIFQRLPERAEHASRRGDAPVVRPNPNSDGQKLKASRAYQRHILESMRGGIIALDANDTVVTHNDAVMVLWDVTEKLIGRRLQETGIVLHCPDLVKHMEEARSPGSNGVQFQCTVRNDSHDERLLSVTLRPMHGQDGQRVGTLIYCDDISDREKMQNMLEQFEATSEELQSANEELETTNEELQSTNEELETTNEELQSSNEELETTNEELQSLNEELENMNEELEHRTQELTTLNSRYTDTLQSMPWPVVLVDVQERIQLWNTAAQHLFGVGPTSVVGVDIDRLPLEATARKAMVQRFRTVVKRGKASVLRDVRLSNRADLREFDIHFTPVSRSDGNAEGVLIMFGPANGSRSRLVNNKSSQATGNGQRSSPRPNATKRK